VPTACTITKQSGIECRAVGAEPVYRCPMSKQSGAPPAYMRSRLVCGITSPYPTGRVIQNNHSTDIRSSITFRVDAHTDTRIWCIDSMSVEWLLRMTALPSVDKVATAQYTLAMYSVPCPTDRTAPSSFTAHQCHPEQALDRDQTCLHDIPSG